MQTYKQARNRVLQYTACRLPKDEAIVDATAKRIVETGECVWHAFAQVTNKQCWCAKCMPTAHKFGS